MLRRRSGIATPRRSVCADPMPPLVIFIHGMWMPGHVAGAFRAPLEREFGFKVEVFHYRAGAERLDDVLERLQQRVVAHRPKVLHIVGHSLGGLLALNFFERYPQQVPGLRGHLGFAIVRQSCRPVTEPLGRVPPSRARRRPASSLGLATGTSRVPTAGPATQPKSESTPRRLR